MNAGRSLVVLREWLCPLDGSTAPIQAESPACPKCGRRMVQAVKE